MTDNLLKSQAFKLKGRLFTFTVLQLLESEQAAFEQELAELVIQAPRLFDNAPVILDCSVINPDKLDLQIVCKCLRGYGMIPVAIQGGNPFIDVLAQAQGLAVFHASSNHDRPVFDKAQEPSLDARAKFKTKFVNLPVRSGQQVVSKGGDLVIMAAVSHGAELLADGNIHVYGALRGRALAGIAGETGVRIFCQSLEAELLSIAGFYRLSDTFEPVPGPCQIYLQDECIHIEPL